MGMEPWITGMIINLCGNICINIGTNCVKHDHAKSKLAHDHSGNSVNSSVLSSTEQMDGTPNVPPPPHAICARILAPCLGCFRRFLNHGRWWYIGWSVFTVGNVGNFVSLSFTPQSLLAGLGSSQFLMNAICEWYFNGILITARMVKATILIIIGNTLIVAFASHESPKLTVEELINLLFATPFDIYIIILLILCVALQLYYNDTKAELRKYQTAMLTVLAAGGNVHINGVGNGASGESHASMSGGSMSSGSAVAMNPQGHSAHRQANMVLPVIPPALSPFRLKLLPFSYAAVSAIIGTQSVLLAKATSDLLRTTVDGQNQFDNSFTWVLLTAWISTIVFWLYRMDTALRKFDGPFIVPVLQVVWTLFSIIGGGIYFQEFNKMSDLAIVLFTMGVCVMMGGVYLLAPQPPPTHRSMDDQLSHQDQLNDIELANARDTGLGSPYEIRDGRPSDAPLNASPQIHMFLDDSHSHSGSGHSKDDQPIRSDGVMLGSAPISITRVTSTGRMIIQSDGERSKRDVFVEMSPDFRPYESGIAHGHAVMEADHLTDEDIHDGQPTRPSLDGGMHATAMAKPAAPTRTNSSTLGVLGEAGLLGGGVGLVHTPPMRPAIVHWGTPPTSHSRLTNEYSRPASVSGASHHELHSQSGSIPPSPALTGFDMFGNYMGATKRSRGMSLGFSMPMVEYPDERTQ